MAIDEAKAALRESPPTSRKLKGVAIGLVLAALASSTNLAAAFAEIAPDLALTVKPGDPRATLRKAATMLQGGLPSPQAISLVREAVQRDPTLPLAYTLLSLDPRSTAATRERALAYSRVLSRRDQATTFLLLQNALKQNDIEGFFAHFDIAMRTSVKASEQFSPVMIEAMSDDRVVDGLSDLLSKNPPWGREFLLKAITEAPTAGKAARLLYALRSSGAPPDKNYTGVLINRLLSESNYSEAWKLYQEVFPDRASATLRMVSPPLSTVTGFDWVLTNESDLWAQPEKVGGAYALRYYANAGAGGTVARQSLVLGPGAYRLSYTAFAQAGPSFQSSWIAECKGGSILAKADARSSGRLDFTVPAGCAAVELRLQANSDLNVAENQGLIEGLTLSKSAP